MTQQPPPAASGSPGRVRAGDEERARATSLLSDHYARGRLDDAELDERTSRALTAVYTDELDALFVDLPGAPLALPSVRSHGTGEMAAPRVVQRRSLVPALLVAAVLLVVLTRGAALWLLFPMWWFVGPALLGRRRAHSDLLGPGRTAYGPLASPARRPMAGAGPGCRRWSA